MPELDTDIQAAITKNLPAQVGATLQQRLKDGETAFARAKDYAEQLAQMTKLRDSALEQKYSAEGRAGAAVARLGGIELREAAVTKRELDVCLKEQEARLTTQYAERMVGNHLEVVKAVFGNNRLKYSEQRQETVPMVPVVGPPQYQGGPPTTIFPNTQTLSSAKTTEVEG